MSEISEGPEKVAQQGSGELSEVGIQLHEPAAEQPYRYFSLAGRITAGFLAITVLVAALSVASLELDRWFELQWWSRILIILVVALPVGAWLVGKLVSPIRRVVQGVSDGIRSLRDRDFGVRLAYRRSDELGDLVGLYNSVTGILQEERRSLTQQELLLKTALDRSPAATLLVNSIGRIVYSNR